MVTSDVSDVSDVGVNGGTITFLGLWKGVSLNFTFLTWTMVSDIMELDSDGSIGFSSILRIGIESTGEYSIFVIGLIGMAWLGLEGDDDSE